MRQFLKSGSVRGVPGNWHSYRDRKPTDTSHSVNADNLPTYLGASRGTNLDAFAKGQNLAQGRQAHKDIFNISNRLALCSLRALWEISLFTRQSMLKSQIVTSRFSNSDPGPKGHLSETQYATGSFAPP